MALKIEVDSKKVAAALETAPKKTGIALLRALKRGTKSAKTAGKRLVAKDTGLRAADVAARIRITEPTARTLTGKLHADLKRIPLIKFGAKGSEPSRGRGRGVRTKKGTPLPHAFIATMPSGHRGVFSRAGKSRLPIRQHFGPSVGRVFDNHREEIMARGEEVVIAELDRQLDRMLGVSSAA